MDQGDEPVPLGRRPVLLGGDLLGKQVPLVGQGVEDGGIDILAVGRDLVRGDGQQRLAFLTCWPSWT